MVAYSTSLYERPTLLQCNQWKAGQFQEDTKGDVRPHTSSFNSVYVEHTSGWSPSQLAAWDRDRTYVPDTGILQKLVNFELGK